jgi:hypothetical protein
LKRRRSCSKTGRDFHSEHRGIDAEHSPQDAAVALVSAVWIGIVAATRGAHVNHNRARLPLLLTLSPADLAMLDWCPSDFVLIAMASGAVIVVGIFTVSKIVKW